MRSLSAISGHDAPWCGSKAAWLGELMARGYLVPPGVALSTETFNRFIARPELSGLIARSVEAAATAPPAELRSISDSVRDAFELQDLPAEVVNRLSNWLQKSPRATFAVRSSATNEDLPGATFAGQYDSFLNVPAPEIPRAIVRCFASLFSARAFLYRRRKGFTAPGEMAVIVQAMIHGQHAGVVFTRAPNRPAMLLMECVPGPAEGVVSGAIAPSRYYLDRATLTVVDAVERHQFSQGEIVSVARIAKSIEHHLKCPQDVEYVVANGEVYVLQARPTPQRTSVMNRMVTSS